MATKLKKKWGDLKVNALYASDP